MVSRFRSPTTIWFYSLNINLLVRNKSANPEAKAQNLHREMSSMPKKKRFDPDTTEERRRMKVEATRERVAHFKRRV